MMGLGEDFIGARLPIKRRARVAGRGGSTQPWFLVKGT